MAQRGDEKGPVSDLAEQAAGRVDDAAQWLERHEPGRSSTACAASHGAVRGRSWPVRPLVGVLAGRLTRGAVDAHRDTGGSGPDFDRGQPPRGVPQPGYSPSVGYAPPYGAPPPPVPPPPHAPGGYPGQTYPAGPHTTLPPTAPPPTAPPPSGPPVTQTAPPPLDPLATPPPPRQAPPTRQSPPEAQTGELFVDDLRRDDGYDNPGGPR